MTVKLNVDGSYLGNLGRSGYGGIIHNSSGAWLLGFSGSCGFTTNLNAELQAIAHGLELSWSRGYREVMCESNSETALALVKDGVQQTHPYAPIVDYIRSFTQKDRWLSFHHTLREGNMCADWLAKYGSSMHEG